VLPVTTTPPSAVAYARVSRVSQRGDGRGEPPRPLNPSGTELIGLGVAIALTLIVPLAIGVGVDFLLHSSPIGFLVGLLVGIVAVSVFVVQQFRRYL
jgi:hypothetical protein